MFVNMLAKLIEVFVHWLKQLWFEAKLKACLDMIEFDNRIKAELERKIEQKPIYKEHPIDPVL